MKLKKYLRTALGDGGVIDERRGIDTRRADLPLSCELEVWMDAPRTSREENLRIQRRKQFLCGGARFHSAHNGQHRARQRGSIKGIAAQGETGRRGSRESGSPSE